MRAEVWIVIVNPLPNEVRSPIDGESIWGRGGYGYSLVGPPIYHSMPTVSVSDRPELIGWMHHITMPIEMVGSQLPLCTIPLRMEVAYILVGECLC